MNICELSSKKLSDPEYQTSNGSMRMKTGYTVCNTSKKDKSSKATINETGFVTSRPSITTARLFAKEKHIALLFCPITAMRRKGVLVVWHSADSKGIGWKMSSPVSRLCGILLPSLFFCRFLFSGIKFSNKNISVLGKYHANRNILERVSGFPDFFPNSLTYATAET